MTVQGGIGIWKVEGKGGLQNARGVEATGEEHELDVSSDVNDMEYYGGTACSDFAFPILIIFSLIFLLTT